MPSVRRITLGEDQFCRVLLFAECSALGKPPLCRVPGVCRVLSLWHSANSLFAECPIKSTRQSMGHSAKKPSPVAIRRIKGTKMAKLALFGLPHIRFVRLLFSAGTVFFSYNNSVGTIFFSQFQSKFCQPNESVVWW